MAYISTDEVRTIRNDLKEAFPEFKFSVRYEQNSKSSITVVIKSGPVKFVDTMSFDGRVDNGYMALNHYHLGNYDHSDILQQIMAVVNKKNYNNSQIEYDIHDVGFYVNLYQGEWNKPYVVTSPKKADKPSKTVVVLETLVAKVPTDTMAEINSTEVFGMPFFQ